MLFGSHREPNKKERWCLWYQPVQCLFRQTRGFVAAAKPGFSNNRASPYPSFPSPLPGLLAKTKEQIPLSPAIPDLLPSQAWSMWNFYELSRPGLPLT